MNKHDEHCTCGHCGCEHDYEEACTCGCGTEATFEDGERKFITLELENGIEQEFMVLQIFEACNKKQYIAVVQEDLVGTDKAEAYLYRFHTDKNGDPVLEVITDEEEWDIVCDAFDEILDEIEFNEALAMDED